MDATITRIENLGSNSTGFWLKPIGAFPHFIAGQHTAMVLPNPDLKGPDKAHTYTIASAPCELPEVLIASKNSPSIYKQALAKLKIGDQLAITPPIGDFVLHPGERPVVMLAGGIGATPFRSMLRQVLYEGSTRPFRVIYSNRTPDPSFKEEFDQWPKEHSNVSVTYTITDPSPDWQGEHRMLKADFLQELFPASSQNDYYICGPPGMVDSCLGNLKKLGVPETQLFFERFTGYHENHIHAKQGGL